jgi:C4-dicarboxylate-specific signal transduction histidine kinase
VEDSGAGIDSNALPRLFEPFFTTKTPDEGTGLGLSIAKDIIEDHGGTIEVTSVAGAGSRFEIHLQGVP